MSHTPTPWRLARRSEYDLLTVIETEDDYIADCTEQVGDDRDEANAAFIVLAVNAHDELVAALQKIIDMNVQYAKDRYGDAGKAEDMACVVVARSALSKAHPNPNSPERGIGE